MEATRVGTEDRPSRFEDQVAAEVPGLLRYARTLANDPNVAEDLVSETVLRALERRRQFRGEASVRTWLHRILHNVAIDQHRRQGRSEPVAEPRAPRPTVVADDPAERALRTLDAEEVRQALEHVPFATRSALLLHDAERFSDSEVARILGISLPAAKQRIRRGRLQLLEALAAEPRRRQANRGVPLSCAVARQKIPDLLEGGLDSADQGLLEAHLAHCVSCPPLYRALTGLPATVSELHDPDTVVPPALAERLRLLLAGRAPAPHGPGSGDAASGSALSPGGGP
ncbi:sigma-70 family RNA polymerase sigma factor [Aciditerrimonas ferrireducens]|uniref:Sigma-70 family RNA polymerase sigma factor n=1 Tax=Aciditerrimonas ferrireducens TaxID=667306 RepID=A0ABV6C035_9ACTN